MLDGRLYLSGPMTDRLLRRAPGDQGPDAQGSTPDVLTDHELEVFRLIGEGLTTAEIAGRLHRSVHTIETYRQRIKTKLGLRTSAELARAAVEWVLERG